MSEKTNQETKEWLDVNTIQKQYLPISKAAIRKFMKENLDVTYINGKKMLVEKKQLLAYLRNEI